MCDTTGADETFCLDECGGYQGNITGVDGLLYRYYMVSEAFFSIGEEMRHYSWLLGSLLRSKAAKLSR